MLGDGMRKGFPDLIAIWDGGVSFLEVKRAKRAVVSDEQEALLKRLSDMNHNVAIVRSVEEAHAFLKGCGAPCVGDLQ